ncbi:MAG: hypothetical protein SFY81_09935 [Verrucomicrobiota bacterium]|nr:hypothetical protein [Verrucomicrobiota bacterium]
MKSMKFVPLLAACSLILQAADAPLVPSKPGGERPGEPGQRPLRLEGRSPERLRSGMEEMTAEQRKKSREIMEAAQPKNREFQEKLRTARAELDQLTRSTNKIDEAAIRAKGEALGKIEGEYAIHRASVFTQLKDVLPPELAARMSSPGMGRPRGDDSRPGRPGPAPLAPPAPTAPAEQN